MDNGWVVYLNKYSRSHQLENTFVFDKTNFVCGFPTKLAASAYIKKQRRASASEMAERDDSHVHHLKPPKLILSAYELPRKYFEKCNNFDDILAAGGFYPCRSKHSYDESLFKEQCQEYREVCKRLEIIPFLSCRRCGSPIGVGEDYYAEAGIVHFHCPYPYSLKERTGE